MAKKQKRKYVRNEFVIDPETDADLVTYVSQLKADEDFSGFIRGLLRRAMSGDVNAQTDVQLISAIDELRADLQSVIDAQQRLALEQVSQRAILETVQELSGRLGIVDKLEQDQIEQAEQIAQIASEIKTLRRELKRQPSMIAQQPEAADDDPRQDIFSAKLKRMSFTDLMQ